MVEQRFRVTVVIERRTIVNRWANELWRPARIELVAVAPGFEAAPDAVPDVIAGPDTSPVATALGGPSVPAAEGLSTYWRWKGFTVEVHRSEAEGYYLNMSAAEPRAFVMWRMQDERAIPVMVTVSYSEAARWLDGGAEVEAVDLPPEIRSYLAAWVEQNYRPEPRKKSRRNDPFREGAFRRESR